MSPLTNTSIQHNTQTEPCGNSQLAAMLQGDKRRDQLERYIAGKYEQVHDAHLKEFLPILLRVAEGAETLGAVGLRPGQYRPMFLEQYLDAPIEQQVAAIARQPVDRLSLVEIGNLAVTRRGFAAALFVVLVDLLSAAGFEWLVFTATEQVERIMRIVGFEVHYLVAATPDRLTGDKTIWGSYYDNSPKVMTGRLSDALAVIEANPTLQSIRHEYRQSIKELAPMLADYRRIMRK